MGANNDDDELAFLAREACCSVLCSSVEWTLVNKLYIILIEYKVLTVKTKLRSSTTKDTTSRFPKYRKMHVIKNFLSSTNVMPKRIVLPRLA